jgi:hypothetical protein
LLDGHCQLTQNSAIHGMKRRKKAPTCGAFLHFRSLVSYLR